MLDITINADGARAGDQWVAPNDKNTVDEQARRLISAVPGRADRLYCGRRIGRGTVGRMKRLVTAPGVERRQRSAVWPVVIAMATLFERTPVTCCGRLVAQRPTERQPAAGHDARLLTDEQPVTATAPSP